MQLQASEMTGEDVLVILGCGLNCGVPSALGNWGRCDPSHPKNRRTRSSVLLQKKGFRVVVDTGPDFRYQAQSVDLHSFDSVFSTHAHADHCVGLFELRFCARDTGRDVIPIYADAATLAELEASFPFAFRLSDKHPLHHKVFLAPHCVGGASFNHGPFHVTPIPLPHGPNSVLGYRFDNVAYTTDLSDLPPSSAALLEGLDLWVVSCLDTKPCSTHACLDQIFAWQKALTPKLMVLTHLGLNMDYASVTAMLPSGIMLAYDGLVLPLCI